MEQYPKVVPSAIFSLTQPHERSHHDGLQGVLFACLPELQALALGQVHLVAGLHAKGVVPHVDMRERAVDAPLSEGMGIALRAAANLLLSDVGSPYARVGDEEALLGSESKELLLLLALGGVLERVERHLEATVVGEVLAQREVAVGVEVGQHLDVAEEVGILLGALVEALRVRLRPPVVHVAVLVVVASLVVEAVEHLVTNDHADGAIVEGVVGLRVEEGRQQGSRSRWSSGCSRR